MHWKPLSKTAPTMPDEVQVRLQKVVKEAYENIKAQETVPMDRLRRWLAHTVQLMFKVVQAHKSVRQRNIWEAGKGMLKRLVDFEKFHPTQPCYNCVREVLEKDVVEVFGNYLTFLQTGKVPTRHTQPSHLGETLGCLFLDKPTHFTCSFGGDRHELPEVTGAKTPTQLLNSHEESIQIHEYVALKYGHETAKKTQQFWDRVKKENIIKPPCSCGICGLCASMQAGCCNRLDKETSGVVIIAKTEEVFTGLREQFRSAHSLHEGGAEKYYFALVEGFVKVPVERIEKSPTWIHEANELQQGQGRIEVAVRWDESQRKSLSCINQDVFGNGQGKSKGQSWESQQAITLYTPMAWFTKVTNQRQQEYTLLHLQILTGRKHQIRFHCSEIGHPLVGDPKYGASYTDRLWAQRVFLHSYQAIIRDPSNHDWWSVRSPLPNELGLLLSDLVLVMICSDFQPFLSRSDHLKLSKMFTQYKEEQLLQRYDAQADACRPSPAQATKFVNVNSCFFAEASFLKYVWLFWAESPNSKIYVISNNYDLNLICTCVSPLAQV